MASEAVGLSGGNQMAEEEESPTFDDSLGAMWIFLEQAFDDAFREMSSRIGPEAAKLMEGLGQGILNLKMGLFVGPDTKAASKALAELAPHLSTQEHNEMLSTLAAKYPNVGPWLKQGVEIALAGEGYNRINKAFDRFESVAVTVLAKPVPEKARPYLRELVLTYLFGFDVAAIALARSTLEALCKAVLVHKGIMTEPEIRRNKTTAAASVEKLKQAGYLKTSAGSAERLVRRGNDLIHGTVPTEKVIRVSALDSLNEVAEVARELADHL